MGSDRMMGRNEGGVEEGEELVGGEGGGVIWGLVEIEN